MKMLSELPRPMHCVYKPLIKWKEGADQALWLANLPKGCLTVYSQKQIVPFISSFIHDSNETT